jgi:hypothetical protein
MIDLSEFTRLDWATWEAARDRSLSTSPPTPILIGDALRASFSFDEVEGQRYVAGTSIPVCFSPDERPPPRPGPSVEARAARTAELQQQVRNHVDTHLPPSEREALASIAAGLAERAAFGVPLTEVEQGVAVGLMQARAWSLGALALAGEAAVRCAGCTTLDELQAVTVDLTVLGEPPRVTAGEVALALRGA